MGIFFHVIWNFPYIMLCDQELHKLQEQKYAYEIIGMNDFCSES